MAKLVLLSAGMTGRSHELKVDKTTIGRVEDNTFQIAEPSVSSHHCEVLLRGSEVVVRDLNSTNGTFINGEKITEAVLQPGQILRLGTVEMRLDTGDTSAAPAKPPSTVPPPKSKQPLDQTRIIPQGVKLDELQGTGGPPELGSTTGFEKKTDRWSKILPALFIAVTLALLGALAWVLLKGH